MKKTKNNNQSQIAPSGQKKKTQRPNNRPKRINRGYAKVARSQAIKSNQLISPVQSLEPAQGVLTTINVNVTPVSDAIETAFFGLVSLALIRNLEFPYAFYLGIYSDLVSIMKGQPGSQTSRLSYLNHILASFAPKSVPFRLRTVLAYEFDTSSLPSTPSSSYTIRSYGYFMYVDGNSSVGDFRTQVAPAVPSADAINAAYNSGCTLLAGKEPHRLYVRNVQLDKEYANDTSAYARNAPYYGSGSSTVSGPYGSVESEVPFLSNLLGVITSYTNTDPRSSRKLKVTSGDTCSNFSLGALKIFPTPYYRGAVPPIYKFLDFNELVYSLSAALAQAMSNCYNVVGQGSVDLISAGLPFSQGYFALAVRQQLMAMFSDSQSIGQFLTPELGNNSFEPFRVSSNTYGARPRIPLIIPQVLNENLKMLKMVVRPYATRKYQNDRNHITHIPVWGVFKGYSMPNVFFSLPNGDPQNLFAGELSVTPSIIDGTYDGDVLDLNNNDALDLTVQYYNRIITTCSNQFSSLEAMGGDGNGSPLLQFTRYVTFQSQGSSVTPLKHQLMSPTEKSYVVEKKVEVMRPPSKSKEIKEYTIERYYAPPESSVATEFPQSITSIIPISPTHRSNLSAFILPIIEVESLASPLPSQTQVQVATMESYSFKSSNKTSFGSRMSEIDGSLENYVVGTAARKSGLAEFISALSNANQGGFFGDLFATIGNVSSAIGLSGVSDVAKTAGSIANAIGV